MTRRAQLMTFTTLAALCLISSAPRADDDVIVADNASYRSEQNTQPKSCAEATKDAWFYRQLEMTDGDTSPNVPIPAECQRELVAQGNDAK